jgi:hypothetical protein
MADIIIAFVVTESGLSLLLQSNSAAFLFALVISTEEAAVESEVVLGLQILPL